jgi:hypothetical protein
LKIPAVKVDSEKHIDGLEKVVVYEQSKSEYHVGLCGVNKSVADCLLQEASIWRAAKIDKGAAGVLGLDFAGGIFCLVALDSFAALSEGFIALALTALGLAGVIGCNGSI